MADSELDVTSFPKRVPAASLPECSSSSLSGHPPRGGSDGCPLICPAGPPMVPQSLLPTPRLQPCLPCRGFPVIRGLSARWMRGPLAGEDRSKHTQVACRGLSCVCALLLPLGLTPSPPTPIPHGQDRWGPLLLESREPQPGLQMYSSAPEPSRLGADLLGALRTTPSVSLPAFGRLCLFHKVGSALTRAHMVTGQ